MGDRKTMITLNLAHHRKARVWLKELPDLIYPVTEVIERKINGKASTLIEARCAVVEMVIPTGGRLIYAILGAEFKPDFSDQFCVKVSVSTENGQQIDWSLVDGVDEVRLGLPSEYVGSILEEISSLEKILGSGVLHFKYAAHSRVGSSPRIFRQLAGVVAKLLAHSPERLSEEELAKIISTI